MTQQLTIGIDLGGTNLRTALVAPDGSLLARQSGPNLVGEGRERFLAALLRQLDGVRELAAGQGELSAIGVAIPGLIAADGAILTSLNLRPLEGNNLAEILHGETGLPVQALNDANAAAVGEHRFGAGRGIDSLLAVSIGTGIGAGLILGGTLWSGVDGCAGEFGHIPVEPEGPRCRCGGRGCLELFASGTAIAACARERGLATGCASLADRALSGDRGALAIFEEAGRKLGIAAAAVVNLLNLEAIVFVGGVSGSFDLFAGPLRQELLARALPLPAGRVRLMKGKLGNDAGVLGAASVAFDLVTARAGTLATGLITGADCDRRSYF